MPDKSVVDGPSGQGQNQTASDPTTPTATATATQTQATEPPRDLNLVARADALAKLTLELNIRRLALQNADILTHVRQLIDATADNTAFRDKFESRMAALFKEISAVDEQVKKLATGQRNNGVTLEDLQKMTDTYVKDFEGEMSAIRVIMEDMHGRAEYLPSKETVEKELREFGYLTQHNPQAEQEPSPTGANESRRVLRRKSPRLSVRSGDSGQAERRLEEAIASTKRWNHDHKNTALKEHFFLAKYLRQQAKRDKHFAVHLQKILRKRIEGRLGARSKSQPSTLEEACEGGVWEDVKDTIQEMAGEQRGWMIRYLEKYQG
ncbi:uncharacterized protein J7T54_005971 [Emericellopsis cladophorae]|uniref:Uncharacterized protein n=1 Tax=Emericellopsis cladophorae TaxID=2686198 RepID=A0A9P9Y8U1_9HYPO|nr:uncharacterized protein J7T54_005971 [Emericellopsis cladophorae]KAI6785637.1 hypothetical protein J7T54_005971 [Emericellopsis cladophorae]